MDKDGKVLETGAVVGLAPEEDVKVIVKETDKGLVVEEFKGEEPKDGEVKDGEVKDGDDERTARVVEESDDDKELVGKTDAEQEAIRVRRREERARKKEEARLREEAKDREIAELKAQVGKVAKTQADIEDRDIRSHVASLDRNIEEAKRQMDEARSVRRKALKEQNDEAFDAADEALRATENAIREMSARRENIVDNYNRRVEQDSKPAPADPAVVANARTFHERNKSWYDPRGMNEDSKIAISIDAQVRQEGLDPRTAVYWQEVEKRVKARLPHVQVGPQVQGDEPARKQTTSGSGRETAALGSQTTYTLSAARVAALKEAGMWDDPTQRAKMIKRYRDNDKLASQKGAK